MNTQVRAFIIISTITLFGLALPASAIITTFDSSSQAGWVDTMLSQSEPTTTKGAQDSMQMNGRAIQFGLTSSDAHMMVLSFGTLTGIRDTDTIQDAQLNLTYNFSNASQTFTVYGLTGTVDDTLTWNNAQTRTGFDPANPGGSTSYGSFTAVDGAAANTATTIDLTAAIAAYVRGDITGIAIGTSTVTPGSLSGINDRVLFNTSNHLDANLRPSLMVDSVPEPSTYALIFGLVALVGVVRRRKNRSSSMPMPA